MEQKMHFVFDESVIVFQSCTTRHALITHIEMKVQKGGKRNGRGLRKLLQEGLQVELQILLPPLHQTLWVLSKHLLRGKQPSVHLLLHHQLMWKRGVDTVRKKKLRFCALTANLNSDSFLVWSVRLFYMNGKHWLHHADQWVTNKEREVNYLTKYLPCPFNDCNSHSLTDSKTSTSFWARLLYLLMEVMKVTVSMFHFPFMLAICHLNDINLGGKKKKQSGMTQGLQCKR